MIGNICRKYGVKCKKWNWKAVGLNAIVLFVLLLVFEPTCKSDDYDQVMILAGAYTGEYSPYTLYCNFLFSMFTQMLYSFVPYIPWYYVLQYFLIFVSLTVITSILNRKNVGGSRYREFVIFTALLFCGYELYIRFTFTKVAGIVIISGFIALLDLILENQKMGIKYMLSCLLIVIGLTIRGNMYAVIVEVFISAFVIFLMETKEIHVRMLKQTAQFVLFVSLFFLCSLGMSRMNEYVKSKDEAWNTYIQTNPTRARLQDYDMAYYEDYENEYAALGMSYNDYCAWKGQALYIDHEYFTIELLEGIADIKPIHGKKSIGEILTNAFHNSLTYYLEDTGIYLFLIVAMMIFFLGGKRSLKYIITIFAFCFLAYLYMYYLGRLQHHVDVCVLMAGALLLLYYNDRFDGVEVQKGIKMYLPVCSLVLLFVMTNYDSLSSSSYYGNLYGNIASQKEQQKQNKEALDVLSADKEHYYLFSAIDSLRLYENVWGMFQNIELGYYSNLGICNRYQVPNVEATLKDYGINNIMEESVNSDLIYFATTVYNTAYIDIVTTYIREHYNEKAEIVFVKQVGEISVYSVIAPET